MSMKVCKLVRLTQKDDKGRFVKGEQGGRVTVRSRTVVSEQMVADSEENCAKTGLLYIVNEKLTKERNAIVDKEVEAAREGNAPEAVVAKVEDIDVEEVEEVEEVIPPAKPAEDFKPEDEKGKAGEKKNDKL